MRIPHHDHAHPHPHPHPTLSPTPAPPMQMAAFRDTSTLQGGPSDMLKRHDEGLKLQQQMDQLVHLRIVNV